MINKNARFMDYSPEEMVAEVPVVTEPVLSDVEMIDEAHQDVARNEEIQEKEAVQDELAEAGQEAETFVESLEALIETVEGVIASGYANKTVTNLLSQQISDKLGSHGLEQFSVSIESFGDDNVAYLNASLEGLRDVLWGIWQGEAIRIKRIKDAFVDSFRSYDATAESYKKRIATYKGQLTQSDTLWESKDQKMDRAGLIIPFATNKSSINKLPDFAPDLEVSQYVLKTYPAAVIKEAKKVNDIIASGDFSSYENIIKTVVNKLKGLKHPAHLFNEKYLGPNKYFAGSGFVTVVGKEPKITKPELEPLNALATKAYVDVKRNKLIMLGDVLHSIPVTLAAPVVNTLGGFKYGVSMAEAIATGAASGMIQGAVTGGVANDMFVPTFIMSKDSFNTVFKAADSYIKLLADVEKDTLPIWHDIISLQESMAAKVGKLKIDNSAESKEAIVILNKVIANYTNCIIYPLINELSRVNKNLRNTYYLASYAMKRAK